MKNKKGAAPIIMIVIIIGIIIYFGLASPGYLFMSNSYPAFAVSSSSQILSCTNYCNNQGCNLPPKYNVETYGDYNTKVNVLRIENQQQAQQLTNDDKFIWSIDGSRSTSEKYSLVELDKGITPQKKCNGELDCNFAYTNEVFVLNTQDNLCYLYRSVLETANNSTTTETPTITTSPYTPVENTTPSNPLTNSEPSTPTEPQKNNTLADSISNFLNSLFGWIKGIFQ